MTRKNLLLALIALVLAVAAAIVFFKSEASAPEPTAPKTPGAQVKSQTTVATPEPAPAPAVFDKHRLPTDSASSIWLVVNKRRPVAPADYAPELASPDMQLRLGAGQPEMKVAASAKADLERLAAAAKAAGLPLMLASAYRSYQTQTAVYGNEVGRYGQVQADRQSARPGHSEHQTGLAFDLAPASGKCMIEACFGDLPEGRWLAANAHTYGFVVRYPQGKESITGYLYEPWHLRYVGTELAAELQKQGNPTLEEFFGLPAAPDYAR